ncbi:MAG: SufD family Fe-S cluster assembly protein [Candidatus Absconditicoccaceae bacterium]
MKENYILIHTGENNQIIDRNFGDKLNKKIVLESDSNVKYLVISRGSNIDLDFISSGDGAKFEIYGIFFSKNKEEIIGNISIDLKNSGSNADVYLLSLMGNEAIIKVKGNIDIQKGIKSVNGHLLEENIILGEKIRVNTLPILNVSSNDVSAGHGARIQKLDSEKLFYMMSKGLSDKKSKQIIIKGYIDYILEKFDIGEGEKDEIENMILDYLL